MRNLIQGEEIPSNTTQLKVAESRLDPGLLASIPSVLSAQAPDVIPYSQWPIRGSQVSGFWLVHGDSPFPCVSGKSYSCPLEYQSWFLKCTPQSPVHTPHPHWLLSGVASNNGGKGCQEKISADHANFFPSSPMVILFTILLCFVPWSPGRHSLKDWCAHNYQTCLLLRPSNCSLLIPLHPEARLLLHGPVWGQGNSTRSADLFPLKVNSPDRFEK